MEILNGKIKIFLIRHGRQESPLCNVDVKLADEGRTQAQLVGRRLSGMEIDAVYSSNLIRAIETAEIIKEELCLDLEVKISEDFRETEFGDMTGMSDEVLKVKFKDYFEKREDCDEDIRIPGGENGEEVYKRMKMAMDMVIEDAKNNHYENIVIVSHGGAIRCFLAGILKMPWGRRFTFAKTMENCSITELNYYLDKNNFSIERINDYSHLEGREDLLRSSFDRNVK